MPVPPARPAAFGRRAAAPAAPKLKPWYREGPIVLYLYLMWIEVFTDPHRWLAALGVPGAARLQALMFVPVLAIVAWRLPDLLSARGRRAWFLPLLCYLGVAVVGIPFSVNHGVARIATQLLFLYYALGVATFLYLYSPRRIGILIGIFLFQFVWWAFHARLTGVVAWHPEMANSDGFGPLSLLALAITFFFGRAARTPKVRYGAWLLSAWAVVSIVASFARGVVLSMVLVAGMMWLRSPRKGRMTLVIVGGLLLVIIGAEYLVPQQEAATDLAERDRPHGGFAGFYAEVMSSFTEGKSEGTGNDRWELWKAALTVFSTRPILGAGAQNVGIAAAEMLQVGEIGSNYAQNPRTLWGRQLHNIYFQILSEFGLLGTAAYLAILIDFWRKNSRLRRRARGEYWNAVSGGQFELYYLAIALEMGMVAFLATAFFYNTLYLIWSFAMWYINRLLFFASSEPAQPVSGPRARGSRVVPLPARVAQ